MKRNKEAANETIHKLIEIARHHFTEYGFADASTEDIVHEAELTRGALYHHFGSKKGLFQAVLGAVQNDVAQRLEAEAGKSEDMWEQLLLGCRAFVSAAVEPRNSRILLIDGPAVLGWEVWRELDEQNSMRLLRGQLQMMQEHGLLRPVPVEAMTHFLSGALNESALWIAQMPDSSQSLEETMTVMTLFLQGYRE
ncbi:TetR/AcrR family transcriptional regulator [Paenibacillaceae bacterium]|nr:TetR/AcrR family transcriptional regulator [Paenibacillaceae bacterium]